MNASYKNIHSDADRLHHRLESMVDDRSHAGAEAASKEGRNVLEVIESDRPPRSIEDAIKRVQQKLESLRSEQNAGMSPQDAGTLVDEYERLRRSCRELPNY